VVVTHHQVIPPRGGTHDDTVARAPLAIEALETCGVDLLLAGHLHVGYSDDARALHPHVRRSIIVAQAGTAISTRGRGEPNSYNLIGVDGRGVEITVLAWQGAGFAPVSSEGYVRRGGEWQRATA
jgi:3',5'-cyclic AMP phosphodiesterase CpdA